MYRYTMVLFLLCTRTQHTLFKVQRNLLTIQRKNRQQGGGDQEAVGCGWVRGCLCTWVRVKYVEGRVSFVYFQSDY